MRRRPVWWPRWARDRGRKSPRSPRGWPNRTASGSSAAPRKTAPGRAPVRRLWGIGPVAEENCTGRASTPSAQLAALREAEVANILGATGRACAAPVRTRYRRPSGRGTASETDQRGIDIRTDLTTMDQMREATGRSPSRRIAVTERRSRRPDGDGQAEKIGHEHADPCQPATTASGCTVGCRNLCSAVDANGSDGFR